MPLRIGATVDDTYVYVDPKFADWEKNTQTTSQNLRPMEEKR